MGHKIMAIFEYGREEIGRGIGREENGEVRDD